MAATSPLGQRGREVREEVGKERDGEKKKERGDEKGGWKEEERHIVRQRRGRGA